MNIFLVDDDTISLSILKESLKVKGFNVSTSFSPEDASMRLPQSNCDLIIIDYIMPNVNGIEFALWVQKHLPNTPIILMSTSLTSKTISVAESAGFYATLDKPIQLGKLFPLLYKMENRGITGKLYNISVNTLLDILIMNPKRRRLRIKNEQSQAEMFIYIDRSEITHAETRLLGTVLKEGVEVFVDILKIQKGRFKEIPWSEPNERKIQIPYQSLVMNASTQIDEEKNTALDTVFKQIMIFEPNPDDLIAIQSTLKDFNFKITYTTSLKEALEHLKKGTFDFVLQSLEMSETDGFSLLKTIKNEYPQMTVGFMSKQVKMIQDVIQDTQMLSFKKPLDIDDFKNYFESSVYLGLNGLLNDISPMDLIQLTLRTQERKQITFKDTKRNATGNLFFEWGQLIHAKYESLMGKEAFLEILKTKQGLFYDVDWEEPADRTLANISPHKLMLSAFSAENKETMVGGLKVKPEAMNSIEARLKKQIAG